MAVGLSPISEQFRYIFRSWRRLLSNSGVGSYWLRCFHLVHDPVASRTLKPRTTGSSLKMNQQKTWLLVTLFASVAVTFFLVSGQQSSAADIPDTAEAREVMAAMTRAYQLLDAPADTLDINQLSEVFIDHPDYLRELDSETQTKLQTQISEILSPAAAQNFGYLTAIKSKKVHRQNGIQLLKSAPLMRFCLHRRIRGCALL